MKKMEKYVDSFGCIVQGEPSRDGGDGAHRMGGYHTGIRARLDLFSIPEAVTELNEWWQPYPHDFSNYVSQNLQREDGTLRRHPDPARWYSRWDNASRDLIIAVLCGCIATNSVKIARRFVKRHFLSFGWIERIGKRTLPLSIPYFLPFLVAGNPLMNWVDRDTDTTYRAKYKLPDPTLFEVWGLEIRASRAWFLYPLLYLADLETLIGSLIWNKYRNHDYDIINHVYVVSAIQWKYPTFLGKLAHKLLNWEMAKDKFAYYFTWHPENNKDMYELWRPVFDANITKYKN